MRVLANLSLIALSVNKLNEAKEYLNNCLNLIN